ncbi:MAG: cytochrome c3 family protein [Gemmatimonadota bacterium]|nr:cytochrome c3 family protein [Gemmatimonadota bacterium]
MSVKTDGRVRSGVGLIALLGLVALAVPRVVHAQDDATCLMCHATASLFQTKPNPSRYVVTQQTLARSAHGKAGMGCLTCHGELGFPHPPDRTKVDCGSCHPVQGAQHNASLHGQASRRGDRLAPTCDDCHGTHEVRSHRDQLARTAVMNIPFLCGECHQEGTPVSRRRTIPQDSILENYSESIHGAGLFRQGLTVTAVCTSCHTSHFILPHTDPRSSINRANIAATCTQCHSQIERVHRKVIEGQLWEKEPHKIPACVDCHAPHQIRRVIYAAGAANQDCYRCHADRTLRGVAKGDTVSLFVDREAYEASAHSETACAQCHTDVTPAARGRACATSRADNVDCSVCHAGEVTDYQTGLHGQLAGRNDPDAPRCLDCHDYHATKLRVDPSSPTFVRNVPALCARCHRVGEKAAVRIKKDHPDIVRSYEESIHGKGLIQSGLLVTATCSSCHTAHRELPPEDSLSSIYHANVASTCGTCHAGIEEAFRRSIHWTTQDANDGRERPSCKDCHTSHTISRTDLGDFRLQMMNQCGRCHEAETERFFDTFHGKVSRLGEAAAAKCSDCHGAHNILPVSEPASTLSRRNIVGTCAQCHSGANRRFAGYLTHATHHDAKKYPWLFWTFWGMTALLIGTLSFAILHTLAWLWRLSRSPEDWRVRHVVRPGEKLHRRFTFFQRSLHFVMLLGFFTLALTGMALKFSYMTWAQWFAGALGGFSTTGVLHRMGAVALIAVFAIHLVDAVKQKRRSEKTWWAFIRDDTSLIFTGTDAREFWQSIKWFFGRGERPAYGRYTYWEKFDYFAVFWGMFVIGLTGLLLWFPEFFTKVVPGWTVNVATIIHSDEALLAVAFIFTVHFFNTHFRLDKFPMDPVIFTGRVPIEELKRDKPREYERLVASGELQETLVDPYPDGLERAFKVFGFTALGIGLTLIGLIVYSMLFGYR